MRQIDGHALRLRLVRPKDAAYIHALRTDPRYNTHISAVTGGVDEQRAWIERYKRREAEGSEFYYAIERRDGRGLCGVVRLYGIEAGRFTWGSWILDGNKPSKAALESAMLVYRAGFERLDCQIAVFDVRLGNDRTLSFHRRFGAVEVCRGQRDVYFEYSRASFEADQPKLEAILAGRVEAS